MKVKAEPRCRVNFFEFTMFSKFRRIACFCLFFLHLLYNKVRSTGGNQFDFCSKRKQSLGQGRRQFLKSGTAIERHRRSARAEGASRGRIQEGVISPSLKGGSC